MRKINICSFILSIICILLFFIVSTRPSDYRILDQSPLTLVLFFTVITLILGVAGLSNVQGWKGMTRSIATIVITLGLLIFFTFKLFFGSLLG